MLKKLQDISLAAHSAEFTQRLVDFAHDMGFGIVGAEVITQSNGERPEVRYLGNRPRAFVGASDPSIAMIDPAFTYLRRHNTPLVYDQGFYVRAGCSSLWELAAPFGYRTGIAVSVRLSPTAQFILGVDREKPLPTRERHLLHLIAHLQLWAVFSQEAASRLLSSTSPACLPTPMLSSREIEILKWALEGKTAWETGRILGISEHTVAKYSRNAAAKLGATTKVQAALKARQQNLI